MAFTDNHKKILLETARQSILHGLNNHKPLPVGAGDLPEELRRHKASFVTLYNKKNLRGCIGMLEATRPLIIDVAENAYAAAFRDPRFSPITREELLDLTISISILSKSTPIDFTSEEDLLQKIRPGIDGLILSENFHRGTFLPSVWKSLPTPRAFLDQLKIKAGLPPHYWSDKITIERYTSEEFSE
ncbi:MAG: AMMECR1 domain-containing protein [Deltaproteobacteria bacterium RIFCSPLOWO2_12_FULL_50_11]|nr:MAG: AMMECR1 domain-containing protein [Deltaproteobacteria bacterium RIFCSPLOWO2_12_FULL_50_11]